MKGSQRYSLELDHHCIGQIQFHLRRIGGLLQRLIERLLKVRACAGLESKFMLGVLDWRHCGCSGVSAVLVVRIDSEAVEYQY